MPLIRSAKPAAISQNIETERAAGKPENEAVAIGEAVADRARGRRPRKARKPKAKHWLD